MFRFMNRAASWIAKKFTAAKGGFIVGLRYAIHVGHPGAWASDHREETQHITGWNYVAIRAKCLQAAQASVSVYLDEDAVAAKNRRQAIAKAFGSYRLYKSLYGDASDTSEEADARHPLVKLLKRPNSRQSGANFRYEQVMQLESTGTCLIWNVTNRLGQIVERHVIPTAMATPMPPMPHLPHGGWRVDPGASRYSFPLIDHGFVESYGYFRAVGAVIPAEPGDMDDNGQPVGWMQVVRWPHPLFKDDGYSPLSACSLSTDLSEQIDRTRWSQMKNQARPSLLISPSADVDPTTEEFERSAAEFSEKYSSPENAGKVMFVSKGSTVEPVGTNPDEMAYDSGYDQMRDAIMANHGVPPIAAGISGGGSYAAYYAQLKQFTELTIRPLLSLLAEEDTERIAPLFGEGLTIEYEPAAIDDPDMLERRLATDIKAQAITKKEFRALRGMPPFGNERDDELVGAVQACQSDDEHDGDTDPDDTDDGPFASEPGPSNGRHSDERSTGVTGPPRMDNACGPRAPKRWRRRAQHNGHQDGHDDGQQDGHHGGHHDGYQNGHHTIGGH